ncbi:MAG: ethanolamine ammonia-lyase subunit EutB [Gracilibacteraceae bacterium]|jgi:ethanolamine ammonia-lyase large subunit|nr:ethanolamine ammonia-lyase subunit EutB [Gracilibacteraceae bacterium]
MLLKTRLYGKIYQFNDVKDLLAKANEEKSGDSLAGIAARSEQERVAAKIVLAHALVSDLREAPAVPYEQDEVTRLIQDHVDESVYARIRGWSLAELREFILDTATPPAALTELSRGLTAEVIAAVTKLMSNMDLVVAAQKLRVTATCNTTIGGDGVFAARLQPNHPADSIEGIRASLYEGLAYGAGDAVIGLNPVVDSVAGITRILSLFDEVKRRWEIPTQICVLAHITTQLAAIRAGAPTDLIFQSIAGSEKGNEAFGFTAEHVREALALLRERGTGRGPDVLYFETGQGSELSSGAHHGADQLTMEARCYGFAKPFHPFLVNTVVGFIGPEYLYDARQVIRAGLEDHFMGKLTGLPMGCDACYTNHMRADQNDLENLAMLLVSAGCSYVMGLPHGDDIMLNYQSTGYHDAHTLRLLYGKTAIPEFQDWLVRMELIAPDGRPAERFGDASVFLEG